MREITRARDRKRYTKGTHTLQTYRRDAEELLYRQEGVACKRLASEGLQMVGSRSLGFLKLPWDSDAQQDCRKQKGQDSTNHIVDW